VTRIACVIGLAVVNRLVMGSRCVGMSVHVTYLQTKLPIFMNPSMMSLTLISGPSYGWICLPACLLATLNPGLFDSQYSSSVTGLKNLPQLR